jgi:transposase
MPARTGPKPKLTEADSVRIRQLIEQGRSDSEIAHLFGVSRSTILRLRHHLESQTPPPVRKSSLQALIDLSREDYGPCDDAHLDEYCAKRDAAHEAWRREYRPKTSH